MINPRRGLTFVEVLAGMSVFVIGILAAVGCLGSLGASQQRAYHRALAANLAMAIGQYRAQDMIVRSATTLNLGQDLAGLAAASSIYHFEYWNSGSFRNPKAKRFHGADLSLPLGAGNQPTAGGVNGSSWLDTCPLFSAIYHRNFTSAPYSLFSVADRYGFIQRAPSFTASGELSRVAGVDQWGPFKLIGGLPADWNFTRLYFIDQTGGYLTGMQEYSRIGVSFSQPSDPVAWPAGATIKAHFLAASFWLCLRPLEGGAAGKPPLSSLPNAVEVSRPGGSGTLTFLGRYLILDSLEP